jgi:predicted ATP-dependent serine protease
MAGSQTLAMPQGLNHIVHAVINFDTGSFNRARIIAATPASG